MIRSPIPRVLSALRRRRVRALLMGGQACILYGAAEFSRDVDIAVAISAENLDRLRAALTDLDAERIFFPSLSAAALRRGHACHFRCRAPGLHRVRLDVMSVMRGVAPFHVVWRRRIELSLPGAGRVCVMALPDLVRAKKTQRDKDWPMIRRLIEADVAAGEERVTRERFLFWLRECRTPGLLRDLGLRRPELARRVDRPALNRALAGDERAAEQELRAEEDLERERDRRYWAPLRKELERWRLERRL